MLKRLPPSFPFSPYHFSFESVKNKWVLLKGEEDSEAAQAPAP
jgi:hypothetical protein